MTSVTSDFVSEDNWSLLYLSPGLAYVTFAIVCEEAEYEPLAVVAKVMLRVQDEGEYSGVVNTLPTYLVITYLWLHICNASNKTIPTREQ